MSQRIRFGRCLSLYAALCAVTLMLTIPVAHADDDPKVAFEVVPTTGHSQAITSVDVTRDGSRVLSASWDQATKMWDTASGRLIRSFLSDDIVYQALFTPDGNGVVTACGDKKVKIWDAKTGAVVHTLSGHKDGVAAIAISGDGMQLLSGGFDQKIILWDVSREAVIKTFDGYPSSKYSVSFAADGRHAAWIYNDGIAILDTATLTTRNFNPKAPEDPPAAPGALVFSADGNRLYVGETGGEIGIWDVALGERAGSLSGHAATVKAMHLSGDGKRLVSASADATVRIWDGTAGVPALSTLEVEDPNITSVAASRDGSQVIWGGARAGALIVDAKTGQTRALQSLSLPVLAVAYAPDGKTAAWGGSDGGGETAVKLFDVTDGKLLRSFVGHQYPINAITFSPDGTRLATASLDGTVKIWTVANSGLELTLPGLEMSVETVAFTPNGATVVGGDAGGTIWIWDAKSGALLRKYKAHSGSVEVLSISPDGKYLISGSQDRTIKLWSLANGKLLKSSGNQTHFILSGAYAPDGKTFVSGSWNKTLQVWDAATLKPLRTMTGHTGLVTSLAFTPDGSRLISGGQDRSIRVWDYATGKPKLILEGQSGGEKPTASKAAETGNRYWNSFEGIFVAVAPDGKKFLSGSADSTVRLWDLESGEPVARFFNLPGSDWLTMTEAGFFAGSQRSEELINVVRGLTSYSGAQFYEVLYNLDLVREQLNGDLEGKHKNAANTLDLRAVLESGPAPELERLQNKTENGTVTLTVRINSTGGGIGDKLVWRVEAHDDDVACNAALTRGTAGLTKGNLTPPELKGLADDPLASAVVTQTLPLEPGKCHTVEATAYNGKGFLASAPVKFIVDKFGVSGQQRPKMHILTIGVDKYKMKSRQLNYAVADADLFARSMKTVGSELFSDVEITPLFNENVTREKIAAKFAEIAAVSSPADVFVLFLSGHGKSIGNRYYYYPQTLDLDAGEKVEAGGIGQDLWQEWLAKIPAQKTLLIFDTCESGSASALIRGSDSVRQTAMDQLQNATGQNLIAAAGSVQAAIEGYKGHGLLTYALIEALTKNAGQAADEEVKVGALAVYVGERVPKLARTVLDADQRPIHKLSGNNFSIGLRAESLIEAKASDDTIPIEPTHFLLRDELARKKAAPDAESELAPLEAGYMVRLIKTTENGFALIARDGHKIGYVPADALKALH